MSLHSEYRYMLEPTFGCYYVFRALKMLPPYRDQTFTNADFDEMLSYHPPANIAEEHIPAHRNMYDHPPGKNDHQKDILQVG